MYIHVLIGIHFFDTCNLYITLIIFIYLFSVSFTVFTILRFSFKFIQNKHVTKFTHVKQIFINLFKRSKSNINMIGELYLFTVRKNVFK